MEWGIGGWSLEEVREYLASPDEDSRWIGSRKRGSGVARVLIRCGRKASIGVPVMSSSEGLHGYRRLLLSYVSRVGS